MSDYHGCKGEAINSIPYYMIDLIYKTVKPLLLENISNLMFQVIFIFSGWILIKQIIVFFTLFCCWGKPIFIKFCQKCWGGTGESVKMPRFNVFFRNVNTINLKMFPTRGGIYKLEKTQQAFWREIKLLFNHYDNPV